MYNFHWFSIRVYLAHKFSICIFYFRHRTHLLFPYFFSFTSMLQPLFSYTLPLKHARSLHLYKFSILFLDYIPIRQPCIIRTFSFLSQLHINIYWCKLFALIQIFIVLFFMLSIYSFLLFSNIQRWSLFSPLKF